MIARRSILAAALLATLAAGCNIVAPALYIIDGPPKTPAAFDLPNRPTVVFVDDRRNVLSRFELRGVIGDEAIQTLMEKNVISRGFESRDILNLVRKQDTDKDLMAMDAIGRAAGAEQVIYVRIVSFAITPDGFTPRPTAGAEVRVIDVVERKRLFPDDDRETARYVEATMDPMSPDIYKTTAGRRQIEDALGNALGVAVAKLFFEHETNELGGNLR